MRQVTGFAASFPVKLCLVRRWIQLKKKWWVRGRTLMQQDFITQ